MIGVPSLHVVEGNPWTDFAKPDLSLLGSRRGALPDFPAQVFSPAITEFVERAALGAGVTVDHVAVPMLAVASGLIGCSRMAAPSRSWAEPLAMWSILVGFSGTGKTPGIGVSRSALAVIEKNRREKIAELERQHSTRVEAAKAANKKWQKAVTEATETGATPPTMPPDAVSPGPFVPPRLFVSDATIERIGALLQARKSGLLMLVDELAGLFSNMSRYSNGSDREYWLEAWNGGPRPIERVGSPPINVEHCLIALVGGLQPDKMARSFAGDNDGFYARALYSWPAEPQYRPLTDDIEQTPTELLNAFGRLVNLSEADGSDFAPKHLRLTAEARETFEEFREWLDGEKSILDGREREWLAKGASHVLRLAGTIALLEWAWSNETTDLQEIGAPSITAAVDLWREYFRPHAVACLGQIGGSKNSDARQLLLWCKRERVTELDATQVRMKVFSRNIDSKRANAILAELTERGWLRLETRQTSGRASRRWGVNPLLLDGPAFDGLASEIDIARPARPLRPRDDAW